MPSHAEPHSCRYVNRANALSVCGSHPPNTAGLGQFRKTLLTIRFPFSSFLHRPRLWPPLSLSCASHTFNTAALLPKYDLSWLRTSRHDRWLYQAWTSSSSAPSPWRTPASTSLPQGTPNPRISPYPRSHNPIYFLRRPPPAGTTVSDKLRCDRAASRVGYPPTPAHGSQVGPTRPHYDADPCESHGVLGALVRAACGSLAGEISVSSPAGDLRGCWRTVRASASSTGVISFGAGSDGLPP